MKVCKVHEHQDFLWDAFTDQVSFSLQLGICYSDPVFEFGAAVENSANLCQPGPCFYVQPNLTWSCAAGASFTWHTGPSFAMVPTQPTSLTVSRDQTL